MITVVVNGKPYAVQENENLKDLLARENLLAVPCGGRGVCGKCKAFVYGAKNPLTNEEKQTLAQTEIDSGIRLTCQVEVADGLEVRTFSENAYRIQGWDGDTRTVKDPMFNRFGVAVDIGTTTLASCLYDSEGTLLAQANAPNPQRGFGADVVSRIQEALAGKAEALKTVIVKAINGLIEKLSTQARIKKEEIDGLVITGNTTMLYLFTGNSVEPLSHAPFVIEETFGKTYSAQELGITAAEEATVYLPPCAGAFLGADIVTAILSSNMCQNQKTSLLADVGTNGEIALWREGQLYMCATAAGPAFEGVGISSGMAGQIGAIERVYLQDGKIAVKVIGNVKAKGICGSGVIDAVATLLKTGDIDEMGFMEEDCIYLTPEVSFTREDVRAVQLAKGAIHAGIRTLLRSVQIEVEKVDVLYLAGGFGSYLDIEKAGEMSLLPKALTKKTQTLGNAALGGAVRLLLNTQERALCDKYAKTASVVTLSGNPVFTEEYMERMLFE